jgi:hypothetical protein
MNSLAGTTGSEDNGRTLAENIGIAAGVLVAIVLLIAGFFKASAAITRSRVKVTHKEQPESGSSAASTSAASSSASALSALDLVPRDAVARA